MRQMSLCVTVWGDDTTKISEVCHFLRLLSINGNRDSRFKKTLVFCPLIWNPVLATWFSKAIVRSRRADWDGPKTTISSAKLRLARKWSPTVQGMPICRWSMEWWPRKLMTRRNKTRWHSIRSRRNIFGTGFERCQQIEMEFFKPGISSFAFLGAKGLDKVNKVQWYPLLVFQRLFNYLSQNKNLLDEGSATSVSRLLFCKAGIDSSSNVV